jgi:DNA gyrase subunit A
VEKVLKVLQMKMISLSIFTAETHDQIMFFTDKGTVYTMKVYNIPEGTRTTKGRNVVNLIPLKADEKVVEIITVPKEIDDKYLVIATRNGLVKKTKLTEYQNIKQTGIRAIKVQDGDGVINVRITDGKKDVLMCADSWENYSDLLKLMLVPWDVFLKVLKGLYL